MFLENKKVVSCQLSVVSLMLLLCACSAQAAPAKEPIVVNGDKVEYFHEQKRVVGSGNISIEYKGVTLSCDRVTVYLDTREAIAEGAVKVKQKDGAYFTGEKINYNFDTQKGSVLKGYVSAKPFYGRAAKVEKSAEKQFNMDSGYITTCELEKPHYRIQAQQVKIYLDDKVVATNIVFFVWNVPVLYLPYYVQPLRETKTNVTVIPGQDKDWGYYALTSYRYHLSDKQRGDILLDYRTKKGLAEGINHYYEIDAIGAGSLKFYYTHENDNLAAEKTGEVKNRYRYQYRHRWDMGGDTDTTAILEFNKLSDKDVIKDYFYKEFEELQDPNDYNYVSVITTKPEYTTQLLLRKRFDRFFTIIERLPEYSIDIKNYRITKALPIYHKASANGVYLNKTFEKATPSQKDLSTIRFDTNNQLSYAAKLFRFLYVTPYAGTEQTYYSRNRWGDTNLIRGVFNTGVDISTKFYKVYNVETDLLGLDIHRLRHIITPTASYYYTHQPTISPDNLNQFDVMDTVDSKNGVRLALENKLQTKRLQGETFQSVDLATFIVSTDYAFTLKKDNVSFKNQKFKSVDFQLELIPYPWLYTLAKMSVNTKKYLVENASIDVVGHGGDRWFLGAGYRYEDVETGFSNLVTADITYKINEKWKIRAYERLDINKGSFAEQEYTVYRDLHCWIAELTYGTKKSNEQTLWLVMRLKAFPNVPIGLRRTYNRPRFGTAGG